MTTLIPDARLQALRARGSARDMLSSGDEHGLVVDAVTLRAATADIEQLLQSDFDGLDQLHALVRRALQELPMITWIMNPDEKLTAVSEQLTSGLVDMNPAEQASLIDEVLRRRASIRNIFTLVDEFDITDSGDFTDHLLTAVNAVPHPPEEQADDPDGDAAELARAAYGDDWEHLSIGERTASFLRVRAALEALAR